MSELNSGRKLYTNPLVWREDQVYTVEEALGFYNRALIKISKFVE